MSAPRPLGTSQFDAVTIPNSLLPSDGRFGSGPARIRSEQLDALVADGRTVLGTSHRQSAVKSVVRRVREGLAQLLDLPGGYEIVLGNGGSTAFWDIAALCLVHERSAHLVLGEFSAKFAVETRSAPHLAEPIVRESAPGSVPTWDDADGSLASADVVAWPHNETSTGVMLPVSRPTHATQSGALVLVDATSAAGGIAVDIDQTDTYYFAPQKCLGSDGGLWVAALSPATIERAAELEARNDRWVPSFLSLTAAIENSQKNQTLNTPAIATLILLAEQVEWILDQGGLAWADERTRTSSGLLHAWADRREDVTCFVTDPAARSQVVTTLDLAPHVDAAALAARLRREGILDIEPYRKLGRNQLRIATFPSVPPSDVEALVSVLDHVLDSAAA